MITDVMHMGLTIRDTERSVAFYRDVLGFSYVGELLMEGPETERLFRRSGCRARVSYLRSSPALNGPLVELIQFLSEEPEQQDTDLFRTSVSELCFATDDIQAEYERLKARGVEFLSEPQEFDFSASGFGRSRAVYLRDPDGIILELIQNL